MSRPKPGSPIETVSVEELATRCQEESAKAPRDRDPRYCFELFCRAIAGSDEAAWTAIYAQYSSLVRYWLVDTADIESLVQETFTKFNQAVTADRFNAGRFPTLGALLAYMRTIAINLRINEERRTERERRALNAWSQQGQVTGTSDQAERLIRHELADYVQGLLKDEQERLVVSLTFEFDLPPREIARRYPQRFQDVDEVNRIKERLKKRLRRDPRLRRYLD